MEKKTKHALLIGECMHTSSEEDGFFSYKEKWNTTIGRWVCDRIRSNGFYFDKNEELKEFKEKVTEYAKALYQEYLKNKEKTIWTKKK